VDVGFRYDKTAVFIDKVKEAFRIRIVIGEIRL
jgi:hypothetical protein